VVYSPKARAAIPFGHLARSFHSVLSNISFLHVRTRPHRLPIRNLMRIRRGLNPLIVTFGRLGRERGATIR